MFYLLLCNKRTWKSLGAREWKIKIYRVEVVLNFESIKKSRTFVSTRRKHRKWRERSVFNVDVYIPHIMSSWKISISGSSWDFQVHFCSVVWAQLQAMNFVGKIEFEFQERMVEIELCGKNFMRSLAVNWNEFFQLLFLTLFRAIVKGSWSFLECGIYRSDKRESDMKSIKFPSPLCVSTKTNEMRKLKNLGCQSQTFAASSKTIYLLRLSEKCWELFRVSTWHIMELSTNS